MKRTIISILLLICLSQVFGQEWKQIAARPAHVAGVKQDGTLWVWGVDRWGNPGMPNGGMSQSTCPVQLKGNDWAYIGKGGYHTLAIKTDGSLWAWGDNSYGKYAYGLSSLYPTEPVQIGSDTDWKMVTGGISHSVAIKNNGTLWTWGESTDGELGRGQKIQSGTPTLVDTLGNNWKMVSVGFGHTVALKTDGTLWAWGKNDKGQLGDQTYINKNIPTQIGTSNDWKDIAVGASSTVALKNDSTIWVWGDNTYYQLGDSTTTQTNVPRQLGVAKDWVSIASGGNIIAAALKKNGTIWVWGGFYYTYFKKETQINGDTDWEQLASATNFIKKDGSMWAIGDNNYGTVGDGTQYGRSIPVPISTSNCGGLTQIIDIHEGVKLYPNPVKDVLYVDGIDLSGGSVALMDMMGKSQSISFDNGAANVASLVSGIYYIKINTLNEAPKLYKWIKE